MEKIITYLLFLETIYLVTKEYMKYRMGSADLMALRYIHSIYSYLQHDIKLDEKAKAPLKEAVRSLSKKFSSAVLDAVRPDDIVGQFRDLIHEFNEVLRVEEENIAKIASGEKTKTPSRKKSNKETVEEMVF